MAVPSQQARRRRPAPNVAYPQRMELLTFLLLFLAAWLLWRRPERERLAARLLIVGIVLMVFLFTLGTRTSLLPGLNY